MDKMLVISDWTLCHSDLSDNAVGNLKLNPVPQMMLLNPWVIPLLQWLEEQLGECLVRDNDSTIRNLQLIPLSQLLEWLNPLSVVLSIWYCTNFRFLDQGTALKTFWLCFWLHYLLPFDYQMNRSMSLLTRNIQMIVYFWPCSNVLIFFLFFRQGIHILKNTPVLDLVTGQLLSISGQTLCHQGILTLSRFSE